MNKELIERLRHHQKESPKGWTYTTITKETADKAADTIEAQDKRIAELECHLAMTAPDAIRYRWLRTCTTPNEHPFWAICPPAPSAACIGGYQLDAAIDEAMK